MIGCGMGMNVNAAGFEFGAVMILMRWIVITSAFYGGLARLV